LAEIGKAKDPKVAAYTKTYRRSFGHYTLSTVSVMEVVSGFQRPHGQGGLDESRRLNLGIRGKNRQPPFRSGPLVVSRALADPTAGP
jgi:hypothetical protein